MSLYFEFKNAFASPGLCTFFRDLNSGTRKVPTGALCIYLPCAGSCLSKHIRTTHLNSSTSQRMVQPQIVHATAGDKIRAKVKLAEHSPLGDVETSSKDSSISVFDKQRTVGRCNIFWAVCSLQPHSRCAHGMCMKTILEKLHDPTWPLVGRSRNLGHNSPLHFTSVTPITHNSELFWQFSLGVGGERKKRETGEEKKDRKKSKTHRRVWLAQQTENQIWTRHHCARPKESILFVFSVWQSSCSLFLGQWI